MEDQILDAIESKTENRYSKKAFWLFVIACLAYLLMAGMGFFIIATFTDSSVLSTVFIGLFWLLGFVISVFPIIGLAFSVFSIVNKEKYAGKWIAFIGNLILSLILILVLSANFLDIMRGLN